MLFERTAYRIIAPRASTLPGDPLLILGAGRTGKSAIARQFSTLFTAHITLDLETASDRRIFSGNPPFGEVLKAIFFLKGRDIRHKRTLVFLREIQESPEAVHWFGQAGKEKCPFHLVASASVVTPAVRELLEAPGKKTDVFHLHPFNFEEFLEAMGDTPALEAFREVPVPVYAYEKLLHYFHLYSLIGGMPEIISRYSAGRQLSGLRTVYESISGAMNDRLEAGAKSTKNSRLLQDTLQNSFPYAATRIMFNRFANSGYRSRETGEAFRTLERFMYLRLVYPATSTRVDGTEKARAGRARSPRLQLLDTGLVNYFSGIQKPLFQAHDMNAIFEGQIARQVVGQEILAGENLLPSLSFWTRDKAQSTAEVDFVIPYGGLLIPVVVRSGEPGRLRSLHQFIDAAPHPYAVRLYAGQLAIRQSETIRGKKFFLLNLPYFMAGKITSHLGGFIRLAGGSEVAR